MEIATIETRRPSDPTRRFVRHFLEMLLVMMLGMCVLGAAFGELHVLLFGSGVAAAWRDHVALPPLRWRST